MVTSAKNNPKRVLILFMGTFFVLAIGLVYFQSVNSKKSEDPRVNGARELYSKYNDLTTNKDYEGVVSLMDSIESIYLNFPHYINSYEIGVLHNNRCAAYLSMYLHQVQQNNAATAAMTNDSLLALSERYAIKSIENYKGWLERFENKSESQLLDYIQSDFFTGLEGYSPAEKENFLQKRVSVLQQAQSEINQRLSIAYTNLGIIYRHQGKYKIAVDKYNKAIRLWDKNLTAVNNRNMLLGKPLAKHRTIDRFLP